MCSVWYRYVMLIRTWCDSESIDMWWRIYRPPSMDGCRSATVNHAHELLLYDTADKSHRRRRLNAEFQVRSSAWVLSMEQGVWHTYDRDLLWYSLVADRFVGVYNCARSELNYSLRWQWRGAFENAVVWSKAGLNQKHRFHTPQRSHLVPSLLGDVIKEHA